LHILVADVETFPKRLLLVRVACLQTAIDMLILNKHGELYESEGKKIDRFRFNGI
jgi:hypothetical protein